MSLQFASELKERLRSGERLVADGAMGSELIRSGIAPEEVLQANLSQPETVRAIHDHYLAAGAAILTANTFGLRTEADWPGVLRGGLQLSVGAVRASHCEASVWASFVADIVHSEIETLRFVAAHEAYWPDALLIETCTSLDAALTATRLARALPISLLAVTCHFRADALMPDATTPEEAARALTEAGADIVGGNCGEIPDAFIEVAARMRAVTDTPLLFQPSAGLPAQDAEGHWGYPVTAAEFAEVGMRLFAAGANIVGGCCGTTPTYIAALRQRDSTGH
jgi:5-methyltetrahydrofolate--homocysteine methyltransferase